MPRSRCSSSTSFAIGDIERIKALVPAEVVKTVCEPVANKRRPANAYDAQFSIPYLVAASLVRGRFTLAELEPEVLTDERILRLCDRVDYEVDPSRPSRATTRARCRSRSRTAARWCIARP